MTEATEVSVFEEPNVRVTNLRAIIGNKVYVLSNIMSVTVDREDPSSAPMLVALAGAVLTVLGIFGLFTNLGLYGSCAALGLFMLIGGLAISKVAEPTFLLKLTSGRHEMIALESRDETYIRRIAQAISDATAKDGDESAALKFRNEVNLRSVTQARHKRRLVKTLEDIFVKNGRK